MNFRKQCCRAIFLKALLLSCAIAGMGEANTQTGSALRIVVVEGEGATNNVAVGSVRRFVVQVQDENDKPVAGANVTFLLPERGPGGNFFGAYNKLTVTTNEQGNAAANGFQPNLIEGRFEIRVIAALGDRTGTATIVQNNVLQTNLLPTETNNNGVIAKLKSIKVSRRTKKIAAISAGALIVLLIATHGGNESSSAAGTVPGTSIIPGTVSVGTPR